MAVIAGNFFIVATVQNSEAKFFFGLLGILSSFMGACISRQHHTIFLKSLRYHQVGTPVGGYNTPGDIHCFPFRYCCFLSSEASPASLLEPRWSICCKLLNLTFYRLAYLAMFGSFGLFLGFASYQSLKARRVKSCGFTHPFYLANVTFDPYGVSRFFISPYLAVPDLAALGNSVNRGIN